MLWVNPFKLFLCEELGFNRQPACFLCAQSDVVCVRVELSLVKPLSFLSPLFQLPLSSLLASSLLSILILLVYSPLSFVYQMIPNPFSLPFGQIFSLPLDWIFSRDVGHVARGEERREREDRETSSIHSIPSSELKFIPSELAVHPHLRHLLRPFPSLLHCACLVLFSPLFSQSISSRSSLVS